MEIDAVIVGDVNTGARRMVCRDCFGKMGSGVKYEGDVGSISQPNRNDYKTEWGYKAAITRAHKCSDCGRNVSRTT